jgi:protein-S-isoprenylcysteine O-methyltransferase Ste14
MIIFFRQASSLAAPFLFCILFPYFLIASRDRPSALNPLVILVLLGAIVCLAGLVIFILTVRMLIQIGKGTIMPWDPTRRLVTGSLYGYVRNPMILSVITIEAGEALLFDSWWLALLALAFFLLNTVYFILSEEPGLEKRFGQEYVEYKKNVPRWIPRLKPWNPGQSGAKKQVS